MDYPEATRDDIEQNEAIDVLVRVESVDESVGDNFDLKATLADRTGKQFGLTVFEGDGDNYTLSPGKWYVLRNASGNVYNGNPELRSNFGKMTVEQVRPPSPEVAPIRESEADHGDPADSGGIVALDIETLVTVPEEVLNLGDSEHVELLCVALGYQQSPGGPVETTVLFRDDCTPESEIALVGGVCEWIRQRDPDELVTFSGADFDIPHLENRPELAGATTSPFANLLESVEHRDVDPGHALEQVADVEPTYWDVYDHSLNPTEWRVEQGVARSDLADPEVTGGDVPYFGERYLDLREQGARDSRECRALRELLRQYAVRDVEPLFEIRRN